MRANTPPATPATSLLIDVTRLVSRRMEGKLPTGVDRVGLEYVRYYGHRARAVIRWAWRSWVLPREQSAQLFALLLEPSFEPESAKSAVPIIALGIVKGWFQKKYGQNTAGEFLFNTGHSGLENPHYSAMLKAMQVRPLFVVHDLIPITHPEYSRVGEDHKHVTRMNQLLAVASGVITNSQATLDDLSRYAQQSAQLVPAAAVGLLAPGMTLQIQPGTRPIAAPYFVILSTIEPRKNHVMLLQIWRRLVETMGVDGANRAPHLLVIGQRGWECENVVDLLERCTELKGVVTELNGCSDQDLITYLHHAQALLFPSFAEGYGMPLVEALALGVPVIASDLPVFREIAADIPEYIDPLDGRRWIEMITEYAQPDSARRAAQLERITQFKTPGWEDHFASVDALLAQLTQSAQSAVLDSSGQVGAA